MPKKIYRLREVLGVTGLSPPSVDSSSWAVSCAASAVRACRVGWDSDGRRAVSRIPAFHRAAA